MSVCQSEALYKVWPLDCWTQSARGYKEVTIRRKTELPKFKEEKRKLPRPKATCTCLMRKPRFSVTCYPLKRWQAKFLQKWKLWKNKKHEAVPEVKTMRKIKKPISVANRDYCSQTLNKMANAPDPVDLQDALTTHSQLKWSPDLPQLLGD